MSEAEEWTRYIAELRQVAEQTGDAERRRRLFDLADEWEQFADELDGPGRPAARPRLALHGLSCSKK